MIDILRACADYGLKHSPCNYKIGAMVRLGRTCYFGCNTGKTHPKSPSPWRYVHAEFDAILKAARHGKVEGAILYVARYRKDGRFGLAMPCDYCSYIIRRVGIQRVVFSCDSLADDARFRIVGIDNA